MFGFFNYFFNFSIVVLLTKLNPVIVCWKPWPFTLYSHSCKISKHILWKININLCNVVITCNLWFLREGVYKNIEWRILWYRSSLAVLLRVNEPKSLLVFAWFLTSYSLSETSVAKYLSWIERVCCDRSVSWPRNVNVREHLLSVVQQMKPTGIQWETEKLVTE